jgi:hypothetical protein
MTDAGGLLRTDEAPRPTCRSLHSAGGWPHSGYQSRASVAEGAKLNAQGTGTIKIAVPAWN